MSIPSTGGAIWQAKEKEGWLAETTGYRVLGYEDDRKLPENAHPPTMVWGDVSKLQPQFERDTS